MIGSIRKMNDDRTGIRTNLGGGAYDNLLAFVVLFFFLFLSFAGVPLALLFSLMARIPLGTSFGIGETILICLLAWEAIRRLFMEDNESGSKYDEDTVDTLRLLVYA